MRLASLRWLRLDVLPSPAAQHLAEPSTVHAKFLGQDSHLLAVGAADPQCRDLLSGEFGCSVPPMNIAISHVVSVASWIKMGGVHARRVVAAMADVLAFGDRPVRQLPRDAMCVLRSYGSAWPALKDSVAHVARLAADPRPTFVRAPFIDLRPETLLAGLHGLMGASALDRTEPATTFIADLSDHIDAAALAGVDHGSHVWSLS